MCRHFVTIWLWACSDGISLTVDLRCSQSSTRRARLTTQNTLCFSRDNHLHSNMGQSHDSWYVHGACDCMQASRDSSLTFLRTRVYRGVRRPRSLQWPPSIHTRRQCHGGTSASWRCASLVADGKGWRSVLSKSLWGVPSRTTDFQSSQEN